MANYNYTVPSSGANNVGAGTATLPDTLELGDTLTLKFGTQGSNWSFSQTHGFFTSSQMGTNIHTTDSTNNTTDDYILNCTGTYPSGQQFTLVIDKSANSVSPYHQLIINTRSLDSNITPNLTGTSTYDVGNGNITFSYTNGGAYTRYRVITTSASSSPSGTVINGRGCGNAAGTSGSIIIENKSPGNELCDIQGSSVSYKVQYRPRNLATTYQDTGDSFTLTHLVDGAGIISAANDNASAASVTVTITGSTAPPTDCILEFSTTSDFSSNVVTADANRQATFTQDRGTTVTYYGRFRNSTTNAVSAGVPSQVVSTVGYLALNDNEITMAVQSVNVSPYYSGSIGAFSYTNGGASAEYRLVSNNTPTFEVDGPQSGSSGSWTVSSSEIPPVNTTWTYFVQGQRRESQGGQPNSWAQTTITGSAANELTIFREDYTPADTTFTASNPTIDWDATSFDTTLTGVQIGDEIQITLNSDLGVVFEDFTTITSTTQVITCNAATVNSTNLPYGQTTTCRARVRRPASADGTGNVEGFQTFTVTRDYREGPFGEIEIQTPTGGSVTIGAQKYAAYDIGSTESVVIGGTNMISGAEYILKVTSGTTQSGATSGEVFRETATGATPTASGGLAFADLPTPTNTCEYTVFCIIPTSIGGDGSTEWGCSPSLTYSALNPTLVDVTRQGYVQPDGVITITTSATFVSGSSYRIGSSSTSETISFSDGDSVTEYRLQEYNGTTPAGVIDTSTTGPTGSFTIGSSDLPATGGANQATYAIEFRVPEANDGVGTWGTNLSTNSLTFIRDFLIQPTLGTLNAYASASNGAQIVPTVERTNAGGSGDLEYSWSTTNSAPTNWTSTGLSSQASGIDIAAAGVSRASTNLYMGVREKSLVDSSVSTATYVSNTNGPFYNEVDTLASRLITMTYDGVDYEPSLGEQVIIDATELTKNVTVKGSLSSSLAKTAYTETQVTPDTAGFSITSSVTNYSSFSLRTDTAATLNGVSRSANYLVGSDTVNSAGNAVLTISNPDEIVDAGNTLGYTLYEYVFTARGGDGIEVATTPTIDNNMVIRRRGVIDGDITVTVPKKNLTPTDGSQTITIADGGNGTEYRIRVTGSTDANSDGSPPGTGTTVGTPSSRTGNGDIVLNSNDLPAEGDTVSYKVQFREAGTSDVYQDCIGTNATFTIGRIQNFTITDGAPNTNRQTDTDYDSNTITVDGISGTETVTVRQNSNNGLVTWALSEVNGSGTFDSSDKSITNGQSLVIRFTTSTLEDTSRTIRVTFTGSGHTELWTLKTGADTGSGAGAGDAGAGGVYGLIINNSSGNNLIDGNSRVVRQVASNETNPLDLNGDGTTSSAQSVSGLTNSVDWTVVVTATRTPTSGEQAAKFSVNKGTGSFTITNNTEDDGSGDPNNSRRRFYWRVFKNG